MNIKSLTLEELQQLQDQVQEEINTRPDGYFYIGLIAKNRVFDREEYPNSIIALQSEDGSDYGDNYLIKIYTNNDAMLEYGWTIVESTGYVPAKYGDPLVLPIYDEPDPTDNYNAEDAS